MTVADDWGLLDPLSVEAGSLVDDAAILHALVEVEAALSASWADAGFAPEWAADLGLEIATLDRAAIAAGNRASGNPVVPLVPQLRAHAEAGRPGAGDWVHRGATSQDILDSAMMLVAARAVAATVQSLGTTADALTTMAVAHRHTIMVGRTLTQHGAPITFGVKVVSWLDGVDAAHGALAALVIPVQLAGAVGTSAALADLADSVDAGPRLRTALAARLGLADPGRSWQAERSPVASLASAVALAIGALGRIAADVLVLSRNEIAEVSEGSRGASSAMPQKQNPTTAVLIRSAGLQAPGLLATVHCSLVGEDERSSGSWHAEWLALRSLLRLAVETSAASVTLASGLVANADRMAANLAADGGIAWAEHAQSVLGRQIGRGAANAAVTAALKQVTAQSPFISAPGLETVDFSAESVFAQCDPIIDAALERHRIRKATA